MKKIYFGRLINAGTMLAAFLCLTFPTTISAAAPGAFDPNFGKSGIVVRDVSPRDLIGDVIAQPDGKIILVGGSGPTSTGAANDFTLLRFNSDGTIDPTFGASGVVTTDFSSRNDLAAAAALQPDGKIVAIGLTISGAFDQIIAVARYLPTGALDTTFDGDGRLTISVTGFLDTANSVALQADGKIVIAGSINDTASALVLRLNQNGSFDDTFDGDGILTTNIEGASIASKVLIQPDGRIIVGGTGFNGSNLDFMVARLTAAGGLDTTFSVNGVAITNVAGGSGNDFLKGMTLQQDGKIVVCGTATILANTSVSAFVRYTAAGNLDTSFAGGGILGLDLSTSGFESASEIHIQNDGKYIANGDDQTNFYLLRLDQNGTKDTAFGNGGTVFSNIIGTNTARASIVYGDKLIAAVQFSGASNFGMVRYNLLNTPSATGDFDGDGFTDSNIYRPSEGNWFILKSGDATVSVERFGLAGDIPMDGDYDGDGRADVCIYRPSSGVWFFRRSSNGSTLGAQFGSGADKPQSGDFDKDGKSDIAVWRPSTGEWFVLRSSSNFSNFFSYPFGASGDIAIQGGAQ